MPQRKTMTERNAQAEALKTIKPNVLKSSTFGDSHHDAIDAQITVLEHPGISGEDIDQNQEDGEWADNVADAAREALDWITGDFTPDTATNATGDLVGSWQELVRG